MGRNKKKFMSVKKYELNDLNSIKTFVFKVELTAI